MKIAVFHELHSGGARRAVNEFAKRLRKNNHVDLYCVDDERNREENKFFDNIYFYKFLPKKWNGADWKTRLYKDTIELFRIKQLHRKIASVINENNYDIAFVHPSKYTQAPYILRFLKPFRVYYCEEALRMVYEKQFGLDKNVLFYKRAYEATVRFIRKKIDSKNIKSSDLVLANSKNTQKKLKEAYGIDSKVIYLGVDTNFFKPERHKKDIDILYIGAKDEIDGYNLLNNAVRLIPGKISVKYHVTNEGWMSDVDLKSLYNRSKIVACLAKNEPFGLIALEAAACGVPVVALNSGGYRESVIDQKTGCLVPNNSKALAEKVELLLKDEQRRARIGKEARKNAQVRWTWDIAAKKLEDVLTKIPKSFKSNIIPVKTKILILVGIFLFSMALRIATLNQIGRTWDELEYMNHGYKLIALIKKGDFNNSFFYTSYNHPPLVKYLYGITANFDLEKYFSNGNPVFKYDLTYSRLLSAIMFSLGVITVVLIGWKIFSPTVGIISGIILSMLPFSLGLSQLVTTESLKILIYPLAILSLILLVEKFSIKRIIIAGILMGFALQAKQSNALLILVLAASFFLQYRILPKKKKIGYVKTRFLATLAVILIGVFVFILIWPQVLFHLREVYEINQKTWSVHFSPKPWQIALSPPEIFFGKLILTPVFYYIVYFFITIPVVILILFFAGVRSILKKGDIYKYIVLLWFSIPFLMSFYSWRQHGLRYIIEVYPAIAIISAVGFDAFINKFTKDSFKKLLYFAPVLIYLFISLWYVKPYYLDYFNELVGGTGAVYKYNLFQTGWWGQGLRDAGLYLKENAPYGSNVGLAISPEHTLLRSEFLEYSTWGFDKKYDYVVVNHYHIIRDRFDDNAIRQNYKLVYQVKADGVTLVYIYKKK